MINQLEALRPAEHETVKQWSGISALAAAQECASSSSSLNEGLVFMR